MIEIKNLNKKRTGMELNNINLYYPTGTLNLVVAKNSGGKSTLMKLVSGAIKPDSGNISLFGESIQDYKKFDSIGYVPSGMPLNEKLAVWNISEIMEDTFLNWDKKLFKKLLTKFSIYSHHSLGELSKGTQKMLMLAIAASHRPKVYLLDEPTLGLDEKHKAILFEMIGEILKNGKATILVSSNAIEDFQEICDSITYIKDGEIFYSGHVYDLSEKYAVIKSSQRPGTHVYGQRRTGAITEYLVDKGVENSSSATLKEIIVLLGGRA